MLGVEKYKSTWGYEELIKKHKLDEYGLWKILGEDPNCDMGGHHHQPDLGIYEGKLSDVLTLAVELPGFWSWGGGGRIVALEPIQKVTEVTAKYRKKQFERLAELEKEVDSIKKELGII